MKAGYSSTVNGFLVVGGNAYRLAKTSADTLHLAEGCQANPGTEACLLIIVDGDARRQAIVLPEGVSPGRPVKYKPSQQAADEDAILFRACRIAEVALEDDPNSRDLYGAIRTYRIKRWGKTDAELAWEQASRVPAWPPPHDFGNP